MILEKLEKPEVTAIESNIDDRFNSAALPTSHLNSSRWILCTVGEDVHRFALVEAAKIWPQENSRAVRGRFIRMLDRYKYSLRHALDLCESKLPATSLRDVRLTSAESYTTALELLIKTASEYAEATRLFSSYHAGNTELWIDRGTGTIHTKLDERTAQYSALELLIGSDKHEFSPLIHLVSLFSGPVFYSPEMQSVIEWGSTVHKIIERVALKRGRLKYQIITQFAKDLFSEFNVVSSFLPQNWQFPWGSAELAQSFFAALQAICTYHLLSVHFGGLRYGLEGVGVDQICLNMKAERLSEEISRIAGLPKEVSARMIACLTLGVDTNTPDPALQPLVPIGEEELAIPGIFVLSSNWARNMLSLHARLSPETFGANSAIFEKRMIATLEAELPFQLEKRANVRIPTPKGPEEIDLVLIDARNYTILVCELRWMIQPGDVREVLNRKRAVRQKVSQARRKLEGVRASMPHTTRALGLQPSLNWTIYGVVVIEGFGGAPSDCPKEIPVVPAAVFIRVVCDTPRLDHAHAILSSPLWLPQQGDDYERTCETSTLCGVSFRRPGLGIGGRSYLNESLPLYVADALDCTVSDLRSLPW